MSASYRDIITQEPGKKGGRPCIRGMRIAVSDVLGWLASGMSPAEIMADYPELTDEDIRAVLAYAADRERRVMIAGCSCSSTRISATGAPPKVIWLRCGNRPTAFVEHILRTHAASIATFVETDDAACLELY